MICRFAYTALLVSLLGTTLRSADDAPRTRMKDVLKARIAADAKKAETNGVAPAPAPAAAKPEPPSVEEKKSGPVTKSTPVTKKNSSASKPTAAAKKESPTVLPQVEVRKSRITELDQQLAKQEQDIARERKNLEVSEVDSALNDAKIARPLAIFGGESSQFRQHVASERVEMMEFEKDLMEAIAHAKTKKEKQELQKQLDNLKRVRRELEKSLR